jgi:hypothetical protein
VARRQRTDDWGFPRWRPYGAGAAAANVRLCDREGCTNPGTCPAPKAPNSPERWWFCPAHAAEYNAGWDYFRGLTDAQAQARARDEAGQRRYARSAHWQWGNEGDGSRSRAELDALRVLGLDADADMIAIKAAWRAAAKASHPDVAGNGADAAERFRAVQAAWDVLCAADAARNAAHR